MKSGYQGGCDYQKGVPGFQMGGARLSKGGVPAYQKGVPAYRHPKLEYVRMTEG